VVAETKPYHLLITDDDPGFRETLRAIFEPHFHTIEASCGEEAIEITESEPVDIALLDMHMRVLTGLDTIRILRSMKIEAPCILITADATDELRESASKQDADVLAKPVSKSELITTVALAIVRVYQDPHVLRNDRPLAG
jgi:CheY-like chemotaxis protein